MAGFCLLVGAGYLVYLALSLRASFPGLHDPSPNVDGYWPRLVHDLYLLFAGILGFAASSSLMIATILQRRWRSRSEPG
jgi:hypothetical protein